MRKSILAVLPSSSFSRVGSCRPGTCTRMRSVPWRWISGSTVPSSLTRRSTIWIDCSTDLPDAIGDRRLRNRQPDQPAAGIADLEAALAAGAEQAAERLRQFAQLGQRSLQIGILDANLDGVGPRRKPGIADLGLAQRAAHVVADLVELLLLDVVGIDLEQKVASRPAGRGRARGAAAPRPARS